ncbi:hypothetical protein [Nocardioides lijunqiniae]|uniref:hypothetical protein n=1 Tax=Nocardioides lijunqiniae TaxID=2760832 RepID=UPI0018779AF9|nr:hypothetical protein [Nocardioides lijunqiniae]
MTRRLPACEVVRWRANDHAWLDHTVLVDDDLAWLSKARRLTLWAVTFPEGWLGRHHGLEWLDIRGGSGQSADFLRGCHGLRYLQLNQVRGLADVSAVAALRDLQLLSLYGLPQVRDLPNLRELDQLIRVELGSMKGISGISPILAAPGLEELQLSRAVALAADDPRRIRDHPSLQAFGWFAEDVPDKVWHPVVTEVAKPPARSMHPEEWFANRS